MKSIIKVRDTASYHLSRCRLLRWLIIKDKVITVFNDSGVGYLGFKKCLMTDDKNLNCIETFDIFNQMIK